jgi:hypothetical protein
MARQLTEQLEREVNAEELLKTEKEKAASAKKSAPVSSAPSAFDTSYMSNTAPPAENPAANQPASPPAGVFTPDAAATVQGADWHTNPPENKSADE